MIAENTMAEPALAGGNYYADGYATTDVRRGVTRSRAGHRLCCLTADFLIGFRRAVIDETGPAADGVFFTIGKKWGAFAATRFESEMAEFHGQPVREFTLARFQACLADMFNAQGWGEVTLDLTRHDQGLIVVTVAEPIFAAFAGRSETPVESLLAGVLGGFFATIFEQDLTAVQTKCQAKGDPAAAFVVGLASRLAGVGNLLAAGKTHDQVVKELAGVRV